MKRLLISVVLALGIVSTSQAYIQPDPADPAADTDACLNCYIHHIFMNRETGGIIRFIDVNRNGDGKIYITYIVEDDPHIVRIPRMMETKGLFDFNEHWECIQ